MSKEILEHIDGLAAKLGVAGEYLWKTVVAGQYAEGVTTLVLAGVFLIFASLGIYGIKLGHTYTPKDKWDGAGNNLMFGSLLIFILFGGFCLACMYDGLIQTLTPEYAAFKFILSQIK